jgi:hypothetical protein
MSGALCSSAGPRAVRPGARGASSGEEYVRPPGTEEA